MSTVECAAFGQAQGRLKALGQTLAQRIGVVDLRAPPLRGSLPPEGVRRLGRPGDVTVFFRFVVGAHLDAVHHHIDVVFFGLLQRRAGFRLPPLRR